MSVLVTGGAGTVGRGVVRELLDRDRRVRVLTRRRDARFAPGVEVLRGDLRVPSSLDGVFDGVEAVFLFPVAATARDVVAQARTAGVRRVVTLSSGAVTTGFDTDFHLPVERAVEDSGVEWTHVRPGEFATNKLELWGPSIRAERVVRDPLPDAAWYPVHERDVAEVAALALTCDGHTGRAYTLNGPELLTRRRQVELIAEALGEPVRFDVVPAAEARRQYLAQGGFAAENADFLLGFEDYGGQESDPDLVADVDPTEFGPMSTAETVTGRSARTFRQWAHEHARDFA